jgi:hypothetical protein
MTIDTDKADMPAHHRGYILPEGMTPACLDELAKLINRHQWDDCDDLDAECAIKAFAIVRAHLP